MEAHVDRVRGIRDIRVAVALRQAVHVADLAGAEVHHHLHGGGRADGRARAQRRQIAPRPIGVLRQRQRDIGRPVVHGAPLALDQRQRPARVELILEHDGAPVGHDREQRVQAPEAPEQRDSHPHAVVGPQVLPLADMPRVLDEAPVLELHTLGRRRRPRGVEDIGHVVGLDRALARFEDRVADAGTEIPEVLERYRIGGGHGADGHDAAELRQALGAGRPDLGEHGEIVLAQEAIDGDERRGVAVVQHIAELARPRPRADGNQRRAEQRHGKIDHHPLDAVVHEEGDLVAPAHAERVQTLREAAHARPRFGIREPRLAAHHELACGLARGHLIEQVGKRAAARRIHEHAHAHVPRYAHIFSIFPRRAQRSFMRDVLGEAALTIARAPVRYTPPQEDD